MRYCTSKPKTFPYIFLINPKDQLEQISNAIGDEYYDVALSKDEQSLLILCKNEGDIIAGITKGNYIVIDSDYFRCVRELSVEEFNKEFEEVAYEYE